MIRSAGTQGYSKDRETNGVDKVVIFDRGCCKSQRHSGQDGAEGENRLHCEGLAARISFRTRDQ